MKSKTINMQNIRGKRIDDQLPSFVLQEATFTELERNTMNFTPPTKKRQWAVDPIQVVKMELVPAIESNNLTIRSEVTSDGKHYNTIISLSDIAYEDDDQADNVSFVGADSEEYHIKPIELAKVNAKVRCDCLDFYWRFATYNAKVNSLEGSVPPLYIKKTSRPDVNQKKVPGVCKHLLKTVVAVKNAGLLR